MKPKAYSYIRFSTPEQLKGDSLRRQLELSETYAEEHGLELDDSLNLRDLGVSAFRKKNRTAGALAAFFNAIDEKLVPIGSVLLVESLDRLSRAEITDALPSFLEIVNAGITVVTLIDRMSYSKESLNQNMGSLMMSLVIMARAHEESATKSKRLSAAWKAKRAIIGDRKLTALTPGWLVLNDDRKSFGLLPDRAKIVRRIFRMALQGYGKRAIAHQFNKEGIEPWGRGRRKGKGWHDSYIQKILSNRAVVGEFQPHGMVNGKRQPLGAPIADYYPRVIDDETFAKVDHRPKGSSGPRSKMSNLFTKLAFDGYTGAAMHFADKGTTKRGKGQWRYLVSDYRRLNPGSARTSWQYKAFESLFLRSLVEVDWQRIAEANENSEAEEMKLQLAMLEDQLKEVADIVERLLGALESSKDPPLTLVKRLSLQEKRKAELEQQIRDQQGKLAEKAQQTQSLLLERSVVEGMAVNVDDIKVRRKLHDLLRRKLRRVDLYPRGISKEWVIPEQDLEVRLKSEEPVFSMTFINGVVRWVACAKGGTICLHEVQTKNGVRMAVEHFERANLRGPLEGFPSSVRRTFEPIDANSLAGGSHASLVQSGAPIAVVEK